MCVCVWERKSLWHWFYLIQAINPFGTRDVRYSFSLCPYLWQRDRSFLPLFASCVWQVITPGTDTEGGEGEIGIEAESDWVRMMLRGWCIGWQMRGWGEGVGWREKSDLAPGCTLLSSYPSLCFFHVSTKGWPACCPRWCCLSGLPSTGCAPLTPTSTDLYLYNWFQGGKAVFLLCFTHTHTHVDSLPTASAPGAHTHIHAAGAVRCQR